MTTWERIKEKINGLWPGESWNIEERNLWRETLHTLDPWALGVALDDVARSYTREKPALKWVLDSYKQIKCANRPKPDPMERINDMEEQERNREHWVTQIRRRISEMDRSTLEVAVKRVRERTRYTIDIDLPVEDWPYIALGFLEAELGEQNEQG